MLQATPLFLLEALIPADCVLIAHRATGAGAVENSLEGIRGAGLLPVGGVEIDVRLTLDGHPVLMHDWSPWRMAGLPGPLRLWPSSLVRRRRLRGSRELVPAFAAALQALPEGIFMSVDLKEGGAALPALREVRRLGMEGRVQLWCREPGALTAVRREATAIPTALLRHGTSEEALATIVQDALRCGANGVSVDWESVTPAFVDGAHAQGLSVYALEEDLETAAEKVRAGINGIVTSRPRDLAALLA